jgi:hypothetical protein
MTAFASTPYLRLQILVVRDITARCALFLSDKNNKAAINFQKVLRNAPHRTHHLPLIRGRHRERPQQLQTALALGSKVLSQQT